MLALLIPQAQMHCQKQQCTMMETQCMLAFLLSQAQTQNIAP